MIVRFLLIFFVVSACTFSPGFKKEPNSKNPKNIGLRQNGVSLAFYNINKMNPKVLPRIQDNIHGCMICPGCGNEEKILVDCDTPSYKEPPRELTYFAYKKINHAFSI